MCNARREMKMILSRDSREWMRGIKRVDFIVYSCWFEVDIGRVTSMRFRMLVVKILLGLIVLVNRCEVWAR